MKLRGGPEFRVQAGAPMMDSHEDIEDNEYDTELRKRALVQIINKIKLPQFDNNKIDKCQFEVPFTTHNTE